MIAQSNIRMPGESKPELALLTDSRKWWLLSSSAEDSVAALLKEAGTEIRRVLVSEYLGTWEKMGISETESRWQK